MLLPRGLSLSTSRHLPDYAALGVLALVVAGSTLAIGAVHPASIAIVLALAGPTAAVVVVRSGWGRGWPLAALFGGLAVVTALQAIPLSSGVVRWLAAENAATFRSSLDAWREAGPSVHPISLDSDATWVEVARLLTYAAVALIAGRVAERFRRQSLALVIFGSAIVLALVTIAHGVLAAKVLYGLYEPRYATPVWLSPLLNQNNLAGYLNLGALCGITLTLSERRLIPLPALSLGIALLAGLVVLSGSRGGLIALAVTVVALIVVRRRTFVRLLAEGYWKPLLGTGIATAAIVAFSLRERTLTAYQETNTKLKLFGWVWDMIRAHPWLGVGRGAFETAFPPYRGVSLAGGNNNVVFAHAECFPLQWAAEWGLPIAVAAIVVLVVVLRPWSRGFAEGSLVGVAGGVVALVAQNLVDVAFEVPAVCIALVVALTCILPKRRLPSDARRSRRKLALASAIVLLSLSLGVWTWQRTTVTSARDRLLAELNTTDFQQSAQAAEFEARLRDALGKRPGEPYLNVLGALAARNSGKPEQALRWISHAIELEPTRSDTYFVLGRILSERGHVLQGLEAMRRALEIEPALSKKVTRYAFKLTEKPELLVRLVPDSPQGAAVALELARHLKGPVRQQFLEAAAARQPNHSEILAARLEGILTAFENDPSDCLADKRAACLAGLQSALTGLERSGLPAEQRLLFEARVKALAGDERGASAMLANKCPLTSEGLECLKTAMRIGVRGASVNDFQSRVQDYLRLACEEAEDCVAAEQAVGDLFAKRQDWVQALLHHEKAAKNGGGGPAWRRYAEVARAAGAEGRAAAAQQRAQRYEQ